GPRARALAARALGGGAAALVLMVGRVFLVARRISGPVERLTVASSGIESGRFEANELADVAARPDEIGRLARSFQTMAREIEARKRRLADWNQNLERMVEQRKAELAGAVAGEQTGRAACDSATPGQRDYRVHQSPQQ